MTNDISPTELARLDIDEAVDKWLKLNGLTDNQIMDLDYSFLDNELESLAINGGNQI